MMTDTDTRILDRIREVTADLDTLDSLRVQYLRKRALLLAAAMQTDIPRMQIATAAGVTVSRAYFVANQAGGMTSPESQLESAPASPRLINAQDVDSWPGWDENNQWAGPGHQLDEWIAFPYPSAE
jgi:hypothetical protein